MITSFMLMLESTVSDFVLVLAGFVFLCGTYVVWPSRWNIPAHIGAGFWFVAYVVPVLVIRIQDKFDPAAYDLFWRVSVVGACFYMAGIFYARIVMGRRVNAIPRKSRLSVVRLHSFDELEDIYLKRLKWIAIAGIVMMIVAITVMGFIPILAEDSFAAKFLRGEYGDAYRPVAPLYRTATVIFSVFMVVFAVAAVRLRSAFWSAILGVSILFMVMTLQREAAAYGILLAAGIWFAAKGRTLLFVLIASGAHVAGTLWYAMLYNFGILKTQLASQVGVSFWESVAGSAPDVSDATEFLGAWVRAGEPLTQGRTFWGGLIPGNYFWNPSTWSLTLGNQHIDPTMISSGGLRLPAPVWGLVSFGVLGVLVVPLIAGIVAGVLAILIRSELPTLDPIGCAFVLALYGVLQDTLGHFYELSYSNVLALLFVLWIIRGAKRTESNGNGLSKSRQRSLQRNSVA